MSELSALLDRGARAEGGARRAARGPTRWPAGASRWCSRSPRPARGSRSRSGWPSSAARRWSCAATSSSSRAASRWGTPPGCCPATCTAIVVRAGSHEVVAELADAAEVPVINGLTPDHHPCQALADLLTLRERFGGLGGPARSPTSATATTSRGRWRVLGRTAGRRGAGSPRREGYRLEPGLAALDTDDPREAAAGADAVYTDVWVSMGDEAEAAAPPRRPRAVPGERRAARRRRRSGRSSSTACRPTPARRSPRTSSTASAPRSGTRPRTASTPRRRCSSCCCADADRDRDRASTAVATARAQRRSRRLDSEPRPRGVTVSTSGFQPGSVGFDSPRGYRFDSYRALSA